MNWSDGQRTFGGGRKIPQHRNAFGTLIKVQVTVRGRLKCFIRIRMLMKLISGLVGLGLVGLGGIALVNSTAFLTPILIGMIILAVLLIIYNMIPEAKTTTATDSIDTLSEPVMVSPEVPNSTIPATTSELPPVVVPFLTPVTRSVDASPNNNSAAFLPQSNSQDAPLFTNMVPPRTQTDSYNTMYLKQTLPVVKSLPIQPQITPQIQTEPPLSPQTEPPLSPLVQKDPLLPLLPTPEPVYVPTPIVISGSNYTSNEAAEMLTEHNKRRMEIGVRPLTWDASLAADAQAWADNLKGRDVPIEYRPRSLQRGENISWDMDINMTPAQTVEGWVDEQAEYYNPAVGFNGSSDGKVACTGPNGKTGGCNNYTQALWSTTTNIGCGIARGNGQPGSKQQWIVCSYSPAGNMVGQKAY